MKINKLPLLKQFSLVPIILHNYIEGYQKIREIGGDIASTRIPINALFLNKPEYVKYVLITNAKNYRKTDLLKPFYHVFGQSFRQTFNF